MVRDKSDIKRDILKARDRSYSSGTCAYCHESLEKGARSEKVIDIYDIHWKCYDFADKMPYWRDKLKLLLWELEQEIKKT